MFSTLTDHSFYHLLSLCSRLTFEIKIGGELSYVFGSNLISRVHILCPLFVLTDTYCCFMLVPLVSKLKIPGTFGKVELKCLPSDPGNSPSFSNFELTKAGNTPKWFMQGSLLVQNDINKEDDGELVVLFAIEELFFEKKSIFRFSLGTALATLRIRSENPKCKLVSQHSFYKPIFCLLSRYVPT